MKQSLKICYASAELAPVAKYGGLADVAGALPKALRKKGHKLVIIIPHYPWLGKEKKTTSVRVNFGSKQEAVNIYEHDYYENICVFSLQHELFDRPEIYGYKDDDKRFILFSRALLEAVVKLNLKPDILHLNDWHSALAAQEICEDAYGRKLDGTTSVLTIHNLAYQGYISPEHKFLINHKSISNLLLLARGIIFADAVNTVSNRYLQEILTPEMGMGLDSLLSSRKAKLKGILNGVDYEVFNPSTDKYLSVNYDVDTLEKKLVNKTSLQKLDGVEINNNIPIIGMVTRLTDQKGINLVSAALPELMKMNLQLIVVGYGEERYHKMFEEHGKRYSKKFAFIPLKGEEPARYVYGGADFLLTPSNFEPCGLGPMIAMRYGTIPLVHSTGGLAESVVDYYQDKEKSNGFSFKKNTPGELICCIKSALNVFKKKKEWTKLQKRAMAADFSWDKAAVKYEKMYYQAIEDHLGRENFERRRVDFNALKTNIFSYCSAWESVPNW